MCSFMGSSGCSVERACHDALVTDKLAFRRQVGLVPRNNAKARSPQGSEAG